MKNSTSKISRSLAILWICLTIAALCQLGWFQIRGQLLVTDLMALFPPVDQDLQVEQVVEQVRNEADRQLIFMVGHTNRDTAKSGAAQLAAGLEQFPGIAAVQANQAGAVEQQWWQFYAPYAGQLLTGSGRTLLQQGRGKDWTEGTLAQVYNPFAAVGARELHSDPFLLTRSFLLGLRDYQGRLQLDDGWLVAEGDDQLNYVMVTARLGIAPYALAGSKELVAEIDSLTRDLSAKEPALKLLRQGTLFYAVHGIRQAQSEISTIGIGSLLGVLLCLLLVFRGSKPIWLSAASISAGLLFAAAMTLLAFGQIHIFTLVIGASLIGVSIDYSFHYLCEWLSGRNNWQPMPALRRILPAICMGLVTSVLAYLVLLMTPFPALRQLAVFSSTGLLGAFLTVVALYPVLLKVPVRRHMPLQSMLITLLTVLRSRAVSRLLHGGLLLLALIALPRLQTDDDIRQLQNVPAALKEQGEAITALLGAGSGQQLLLVQGRDDEEVLESLDVITSRLHQAVAAGALDGFHSIAPMVPSSRRQKSDFRLVREQLVKPWLPFLAGQLKLDLASPYRDDFIPLTVDQWLESPVSSGWRKLWPGRSGGQSWAVVPLGRINDVRVIEELAADFKNAHYVSPADEFSALFKAYRLRVTALLVAGYAAILLLLWVRYGRQKAVRILWAPCLAGATSLSCLSILGLPLNLFGILGLVLVLGIGIDYTLFMAECRVKPAATLLAVCLSAVTTLLSFGLLALSQTAAIMTFGLVVLVGILVAFILSPTACDCLAGDPFDATGE